MRSLYCIISLFLVAIAAPFVAFSQYGTLDGSFGAGGHSQTDVSGYSDDITSVIMQQDGKILMNGSAQYTDPDGGTTVLIPIVCRFNSDGSPDANFNSTAFASLTVPTFANSYFTDVQQESSGKLLFYGSRHSDFFIVRMNLSGTIDNSFGENGKVVYDINGSYDLAHGMIILADKKLLGVGQTLVDNKLKPIILRFLEDGTLDTGFGTGGYTIIQNITTAGFFIDVEETSDGKLIAAGYTMDPITDLNWFYLVRFNAVGTVDSTFGTNGEVKFDFGVGTNSFLSKMSLQDDGKIVTVGKSYTLSSSACIARFNPDGSLDAGFQGGGKQMFAWGLTSSSAASCLVQPDQKIVLTGYASNATADESFVMMRLLSTGAPDNTFGTNGIAENNFGEVAAIATCSVMQADGKLIAGGYNGEDALVARYSGLFVLGTGSVPSSPYSFQLYPNPADNFTTLSCSMPKSETVAISLRNIIGEEIAPLYTGFIAKGEQQIGLSLPENLPAGIYYCHLQTSSGLNVVPLAIVK